MVGMNKGLVAIAAVAALGFVTFEDLAKGFITPAQSYTPAQVAARDNAVVPTGTLRDRAATSLRTLTEKQEANRTAEAAPKCREQSWPYYSSDCLVRSDGAQISPVVRVVGIDRHVRRAAQPAVAREPILPAWLQHASWRLVPPI